MINNWLQHCFGFKFGEVITGHCFNLSHKGQMMELLSSYRGETQLSLMKNSLSRAFNL